MSLMKRPDDIYKTFGIPLVVIIVLFTLILVQGITSLRIKELRIHLQRIGEESGSKSNLALVAKYRQLQDGTARDFEGQSNYLSEAEFMSIIAASPEDKIETQGLVSYFEGPTLFFVNALSYVFGTKRIQDSSEDEKRALLTLAIFYERKRQYLNAIKVFSTAIEAFQGEPDKITFSLLHRGFCFFMLGENQRAKDDYQAIISIDPSGEEGVIAELFLSQMNEVSRKVRAIRKQKDSVRKGLDYYKIMTYTKAIQTFDKIEKKREATDELYFYRGRAYEEIGFVKNAVKNYQKVIKQDPDSRLAQKSYQRLYILGAYYEGNQKLKEKAEKKLAILGDDTFIRESRSIEKNVEADRITKLPQTEAIRSAIKTVEEKTDAKIKKDITPPESPKPEKQSAKDTVDPAPTKEKDDDFLVNLSVGKEEKQKNLAFIQKNLKKLNPLLKENDRVLKEEKERAGEKYLSLVERLTEEEKQQDEEIGARRGISDKSKLKRSSRDILFAPETKPRVRKKLIKKLYKKVDKILTADRTPIIGHVVKEDSSRLYVITPNGLIEIKRNEISMRISGKTRDMLK